MVNQIPPHSGDGGKGMGPDPPADQHFCYVWLYEWINDSFQILAYFTAARVYPGTLYSWIWWRRLVILVCDSSVCSEELGIQQNTPLLHSWGTKLKRLHPVFEYSWILGVCRYFRVPRTVLDLWCAVCRYVGLQKMKNRIKKVLVQKDLNIQYSTGKEEAVPGTLW